ncbi:hypothetical protein CPB84DRAFT_1749061 [Gymnopilus junonius]|uniref:Uncharacterized protein n=1 Tax=Gymnopilus junonius TaxID=109634 RepID=A0A9P5TK14_GYMJU|nr:hypothetical protein CPB84DRAFT_1749061 [Gymnopilus junonius]
MPVCANTSNSKAPRVSRYNTRSSHMNKKDSGGAHCPPTSVPWTPSPAPAPDPKEVFRSRYYAHLAAKKDVPRIKPALAEPNAGVPVAPVAVPSSQHGTCQQPTTEQKVQEFLHRHRRVQEEKQEMEENERAANAREFKKRWERVNRGGKVAYADAYENSGAEGWFELQQQQQHRSRTEPFIFLITDLFRV